MEMRELKLLSIFFNRPPLEGAAGELAWIFIQHHGGHHHRTLSARFREIGKRWEIYIAPFQVEQGWLKVNLELFKISLAAAQLGQWHCFERWSVTLIRRPRSWCHLMSRSNWPTMVGRNSLRILFMSARFHGTLDKVALRIGETNSLSLSLSAASTLFTMDVSDLSDSNFKVRPTGICTLRQRCGMYQDRQQVHTELFRSVGWYFWERFQMEAINRPNAYTSAANQSMSSPNKHSELCQS